MLVKNLTYNELCEYIGENVTLRSNCEFVPFFNVSGRLLSVTIDKSEYILTIKTKPTGKELPVGSNMRNLTIIKC